MSRRGGGAPSWRRVDVPQAEKVDSFSAAMYPSRPFYDLLGGLRSAPWTAAEVLAVVDDIGASAESGAASRRVSNHNSVDVAPFVERVLSLKAPERVLPRALPKVLLETGPIRERYAGRRRQPQPREKPRRPTSTRPAAKPNAAPDDAKSAAGSEEASGDEDDDKISIPIDDDSEGSLAGDGGSGDELTM